MNKWIAEFELENGDKMPEHMDLEYKGAKIDFHCRPLEQESTTKNNLGVDAVSRQAVLDLIADYDLSMGQVVRCIHALPSVTPQEPKILALLDKTFDDFCNCPGGESYFHIDGEDYNTDAVYALEGMEIFIKVLKKRLVKSED